MSQLSPEQYQEKLSKLTFTNPKLRVFTGFFLNQMDNILAPLLVGGLVMTGPGAIGPKITIGLMAACIAGAQVWLATKGYTPSKVLLGRKVIDVNTLEKASVANILIRPVIATFWMYFMIGVTFFAAALGGAFAGLFHVNERNRYDAAYNDALTASMATASGGFMMKILTKNPRVVWLHDTLLKTTVISVPYSQVVAELKGEQPKQIKAQSQHVEQKKAA
jgi:hypothetical protein